MDLASWTVVLAAVAIVVSLMAWRAASRDANASERSADFARRAVDQAAEANRIARAAVDEATAQNKLARELELQRRADDVRSRLSIEKWDNVSFALCNHRNEPLDNVRLVADGSTGDPALVRQTPDGVRLDGWGAYEFMVVDADGSLPPAALLVTFAGQHQPVPLPVPTEYPERFIYRSNGEKVPDTTPWRIHAPHY